jgi:chorismate mutase
MAIRGIRGAVTAKKNTRAEIVAATTKLLREMKSSNKLKVADIASAVFSVTKDLNAEFPAVAARKIGWINTPLLCTYEIAVPRSLKKCIRVLLHVNTGKKQKSIKNVYIGEAKKLRPS